MASQGLLDTIVRRPFVRRPFHEGGTFRIDQSLEIQRYLDSRRANASTWGDGILNLRSDPRKVEVIEEWLHNVQKRLGLFDRMTLLDIERHVEGFMIRHHRMLGLRDGDVRWLRRWLDRHADLDRA